MVYGRSVTVQRHRHSGNLKVSVTDGPTYVLTGVGAGDAYASKKKKNALVCELLILYNIAVWANICKNLSDDYQTFQIPMFVHWPAISNHANCHSKMLIQKVFCMIMSNFLSAWQETWFLKCFAHTVSFTSIRLFGCYDITTSGPTFLILTRSTSRFRISMH